MNDNIARDIANIEYAIEFEKKQQQKAALPEVPKNTITLFLTNYDNAIEFAKGENVMREKLTFPADENTKEVISRLLDKGERIYIDHEAMMGERPREATYELAISIPYDISITELADIEQLAVEVEDMTATDLEDLVERIEQSRDGLRRASEIVDMINNPDKTYTWDELHDGLDKVAKEAKEGSIDLSEENLDPRDEQMVQRVIKEAKEV